MKILFPILFLLLLLSCENPPAEQAEVREAQKVQPPTPEQKQEAIDYVLRPAASELGWIGSKPTGKHHGTIGIESGSIKVVEGEIIGGKIVMNMNDIEVVDLRSDEDSQMKLTEHLKSDDFFDVANHPTAIFEITSVNLYDSASMEIYNNEPSSVEEYTINDPSHKITGNLTLRDTTLSVTFPAYVQVAPDQLVAKAKFSIDRTLWNVSYNKEAEFADKMQDQLIFNTVYLSFDILANPEKEIL